MLKEFKEHLQNKVLATNELEYGLKFYNKETALQKKYIALNQKYRKYIAIDLDIKGSAYLWCDKNLPPPTHITINRENTHCHYLYGLKTPIIHTDNAHSKPIDYFNFIRNSINTTLGGDINYTGLITKNPLNNTWNSIYHNAFYDLEDFKEYPLLQPRKQNLSLTGYGRNVNLFNQIRLWAYKEVKTHTHQEIFFRTVLNKCTENNLNFEPVLPASEVRATAKSIAKYCWNKRYDLSEKGVLGLPEELDLKTKQALGSLHIQECRKQETIDKMISGIMNILGKGEKVTQYSLAQQTGLGTRTIQNHWKTILNKNLFT